MSSPSQRKRKRGRAPARVLSLLAWVLLVAPLQPSFGSSELPPPLSRFFDAFRAAAQSGDSAALARLAHPASRACGVDGPAGPWARIAGQYRRIFGHSLGVERIEWRPSDPQELERRKAGMAARGGARLPVDPEGRLQVTWATEPDRARAANLHVARHGGAWRWVHVCLTP